MAVLPGVLGCRTLRRTVQVRLGTNPAVRGTVARWHAHLRVLATPIHEISGLGHSFRTLGENLILILGSRLNSHEILCQSEIQSSVN
ncbi:MAG: hypothetical protein V3W07_08565 [Syntrophobacteria bacterium]